MKPFLPLLVGLIAWTLSPFVSPPALAQDEPEPLRCGNLIYAGTKSSTCFSDKFLKTVKTKTKITPELAFTPVKLGGDKLFDFPFSIMTGEGKFTLLARERVNLKQYLERGGFLLARPAAPRPNGVARSEPSSRPCFPMPNSSTSR